MGHFVLGIGRVYEISLYPFSFKEYLMYYPSNDIDEVFDFYVKKGGMAGSYLYKTEEDARWLSDSQK